jgi:sugar phosphate isomerase/epimerase
MSTIRSGLVSITFRKLTPRQVVDASAAAGLAGIEWGGDVHVPLGNLAQAAEVRRMTTDAGLTVAAYGSYYRAGTSEAAGLTFESVLETARVLGAPVIRIWAGPKGSEKMDAAARAGIVADSRRIAGLAARAGIVVASEYHGGTLTDTDLSAAAYLAEVGHNNFKTYWQPRVGNDVEEAVASLTLVLPQLAHLHVFHWWPDVAHRLPLSAGTDRWSRYLALAATRPGDGFAMLEFVPNDDPALLPAEAATLIQWLKALPER